jgi:predicted DNA-binding transcriptional regulator AlpA|tara:strand:+ start:83 stop:262 length:180 start_codon:yes stop_codon:yes gene_type:complete
MEKDQKGITMKETMEKLSVKSRTTVYKIEAEGRIRRINNRLGIRKVLYLEEDIDKLLEG